MRGADLVGGRKVPLVQFLYPVSIQKDDRRRGDTT